MQRAALFKEIFVGHRALTGATEKYFDQLDTGPTGTEMIGSEYLKIQNGEAVAFGEYALIEAILPTTARDLTALTLHLSDPAVTVYARDVLAAPYESATRYQRFVVSGSPAVIAGDTYTIKT